MPNAIRVAVAGAGYFSRFHLDAWAAMEGVEVVGVCDPDEMRARDAAERGGGAMVFGDFETMLGETGPDLVDIVTPEATHRDLAARASASARLVICQKPLAPTVGEARAVVDDAAAAGATLIVHENFRWQPWYREARRFIDSGKLGRLHSVAFRLRPGDGQGAEAYLERQPFFRDMRRFLIHETAIHQIDTFRFLMGEVTGVFARLRRINDGIAGEDAGYVVFEFEGGASGLFDGNRCNDHAAANKRLTMGEMWLEGEGGVLRLDGWGRLWFRPHLGEEAEVHYAWEDDGSFGAGCVAAFQQHVVDHLRDGAPLERDARDYLRSIAVEEAIYASAESGRWLDVDYG